MADTLKPREHLVLQAIEQLEPTDGEIGSWDVRTRLTALLGHPKHKAGREGTATLLNALSRRGYLERRRADKFPFYAYYRLTSFGREALRAPRS